MKIIRLIIAILVFIPLILGYGWQFSALWNELSFTGHQLWFWCAFIGTGLLIFIFLPQGSYFSILKHELIHNLFAILTFKKPEGIHVNRGKGGQFSYSGKSNPLIILSPYFFPLVTSILMLIFLFGLKNINIFFLFFGITCAFDMVTSLKDTHLKQTDLKIYGLFFSIIFIIAFWIINWGMVFNFVVYGSFSQIDNYLYNGLLKIWDILQHFYSICN